MKNTSINDYEIFNGNLLPGVSSKGIYKYLANDNEELYEDNLLSQSADWIYRNYDIEYALNTDGYRTVELNGVDWNNSIVVFGCSITQGIGLNHKDIFCYLLEQHYNLPVINLGDCGSSIEAIAVNNFALSFKDVIPRAVINFYPSPNRITRFNINRPEHLQPYESLDKIVETYKSILPSNNYSADDYLNENTFKAKLYSRLIRTIWKKSTYYEFTWDKDLSEYLNCDSAHKDRVDWARDLIHPGIQSHRNYAARIIKNLGQLS